MKDGEGVKGTYWNTRQDMMYYKYIDFLVRAFAANAKNLIDIGTANTAYIENFDWISEKYALDIKNPYSSPNVKSIEIDFLQYNPERKFDFLTCLQVLEHIPKVESFAKKLFEISDKVLISVPYLWPQGSEEEHLHDPIDLEKLTSWVGREPSYYIIVEEPLRDPRIGKSRRLICYYQNEKINYGKALNSVKKTHEKSNDKGFENMDLQSNTTKDNSDLINFAKNIEDKIANLIEEQQKSMEMMRMERKVWDIEKELIQKIQKNKEYKVKQQKLSNDLDEIINKMNELKNNQKYYLNKYNKIKKSRTWRATKPIRLVGGLIKGKFNRSN
jgi:hypothetical protein